ncbi:MAG TPA: D-alanyl-D-alanine carboxypeptidase, partial [Tepidisphaeraceae bacterium]|nr:D-alanyl-D-alanine carboxypeptidase [Tepidisphaeraceae bacterium]
MRRIALSFLLLFILNDAARADLMGDVRAITTNPQLRNATAAVSIIKLGSTRADDQVVIDLQSHSPMIPASNLKVLTTSLALDRLGADFRFRTLLVSRDDELAIIGDGDPTLGDAEHLREHGWDSTTLFEQWAERLKELNIDRAKILRVDDSIFETLTLCPSWPADQIGLPYVAEVAGINLNANCLDVYVGLKGGATIASFRPASAWIDMKNATQIGSEQSIWLDRKPTANAITVRGTVTGANSAPYRVTVHDPSMFAGHAFNSVLRRSSIE